MNKKQLRLKVLDYASYTVLNHSANYEDIEMLNIIFDTDITLDEVNKLIKELF